MTQKFDVVIVGGGVAGCSLAYALSKRGVKSLIVERDEIAGHASGVAAGLLTPSSEIQEPGPVFDFAQEALRWHLALSERLKEETGMDVLYATQPVLRLAFSPQEAAALREQLGWQEDLKWIQGPNLTALEPCANPASLGAVYSKHEARVDSRRLVKALVEAAVRGGGAIRQGRVIGVEKSSDRITGLALDDRETISADTYVFAMGPWAPEAQAWLDLSLPIKPMRGQILVLQTDKALNHAVFHGGNYVFPQPEGRVLAGTTQEWAGFESRVTPEGQASILQTLKTLTPGLVEAKLIGSRSGLRPVSLDGLPIVGQVPGLQNAFVSTGYGRKGILLGPLLGECLAAFILDGDSHYCLASFDPRRLAVTASAQA